MTEFDLVTNCYMNFSKRVYGHDAPFAGKGSEKARRIMATLTQVKFIVREKNQLKEGFIATQKVRGLVN